MIWSVSCAQKGLLTLWHMVHFPLAMILEGCMVNKTDIEY